MASLFNQKALRKTAILLLQLFTCCLAYGKQIPTVTGILKTDPLFLSGVTVGMASASNTIFVPVVASTADYDIRNTISLKYDLSTDTFFLAPANVRVRVTIDRLDASGSPMTTVTRSLSVNINNKLNKAFLEASMVNLSNGYQVTVTITNIWVNGVAVNTLPRYVSVESEINLDRYYDFSSAANTTPANTQLLASDKDCDGTLDELHVTWSVPTAVPEEYQLEWTYVSNYSASGGTYPASVFTTDFKNNSTRITTAENSYKVSMLYTNCYIVFRVRAVGRNYLNPDEIIYGPWNVADQVNIGSLSSDYQYAITAHETAKNWQYSSTYAEEGKKKEMISYFDGSLHNRQTVTKLNSNKQVILGETLYDFQGRPAVNVLPVPVHFTCVTAGAEPVVKYYTKFNVDDTNKVYSKNDFDMDASGICAPAAAPMDTTSGASQYYSNNNANKSAQQAYLPHAKQYPFTQTEYTPDNTGRIRSQSGVGKDYRLGSGKETKYLYGQPNQVQIDRLFGSESGDAAHYKKNVVIDANGQTSVTYLNQEGKTMATALAGIPPIEGGGPQTRVDSLNYIAQNQSKYTIDLFNKNAVGVSKLNTVPPSNDQLYFSSQLLVAFASTYDFKYTIEIDTLDEACLRSNVCVSCIYDMEIQVKDECGVDLVTSVSPFQPIARTIGNVAVSGGNLTFNTNCLVPDFTDSAKVSLVLQPGVYTINKILKVNQLAKDYYVQKYTDSIYNFCVSTLSDFQAAELAKIDTMDCYNSCASCLAALGAKDDFVASGAGTAEAWDYLAALCSEPCRQKTPCQISYDMLLLDVSPGGQYGKLNQATYDASNEPLSVYNVNNGLSPNIIPGQQAHWKNPLMRINGSLVSQYLDEYGVRTQVSLTETAPNAFLPPVSNAALVYTGANNSKYTYPENLQNLSDFVTVWDPNFAVSLVVFHPEYAYYVSCIDQSIVFPGDFQSSDGVDSLMFLCNTMAQANTAGFINTGYTSPGTALSKVKNIWASSASTPYDPFFTNSTFQYATTANAVTGAMTNITMAGGAYYQVNLQSEMNAIINNYQGTSYTMMDMAAVLTRCGNVFSSGTPAAPCLAFGENFYVSPPYSGANDTIRNREWRLYRQLYFAEKQKLQFKRMNFYAKYSAGANTNYYGGCNACFGTSSFGWFASGMLTLNSFGLPNMASPYFDTSQPCSFGSYSKYPGAVKRFYNPANNGLNASGEAVQLYYATGQCPLTFQLQGFLNAMASSASLTIPGPQSLGTVDEFGVELYTAVSGGSVPVSFVDYSWQTSITGSVLTAQIVDPGSVVKCTLTLDNTGSGIPAFANIIGISQLVFDPAGAGAGAFKAIAVYTSGSATLSANIKGNSSCMDVQNCTAADECPPSQFAVDMNNLLSYLQAAGILDDAGPTAISTNTLLNLMLSPVIKNTLGSPNTDIKYSFVAPDQLTFYDDANPSTKLIFTYTVTPSAAASSIKSFANLHSNNLNEYIMDGLDTAGVVIATINGQAFKATSTQTITLNVGTCDVPDPIECQEKEHQVRKDLQALVKDILTTKPFVANVNLYTQPNYSPLLQSYKSISIGSTTASILSGTTTPSYDTLTIRFITPEPGADSACNFKLYHYRSGAPALNFSDITNVNKLQGTGTPDIAGNYFSFKALATFSNGGSPINDTIYGYSCWPIKNCNSCASPSLFLVNTYTYSTGFNRRTHTYYNGSNNGNRDSSWTLMTTQALTNTPPYSPTGSPTSYPPGTYAYDVSLPGGMAIGNAGYINVSNTSLYAGGAQMATYKTSIVLPNPLPANKVYSLTIKTMAAHEIYQVALNGSSLFSGASGSYTIGPVSVDIDTRTGNTLVGGVNYIEIAAANQGTPGGLSTVRGMVAEVLVQEFNQLCNNGPPDSVFVFPPYVEYYNPCVQQQINLALQNAANYYEQYVDSMTTAFADMYTRHCLSALEKFTYNYTDKEYHHTLYYYDQAGNLTRTIPPEGVAYLPITASTNALDQQINNDRSSGQQNVFTSHRMATKYVYNSLNQLSFQTLPDHDNMDICEGLNPNGIDTGLVINAVHFASPSKGYLCGHIRNGSVNRGYVYTTNDGGNSWTRVTGVTSGDLQKVQFVSSSVGFAVADFGMLFKTTDGGTTWDLLTSLYNPSSGSRYVNTVNDLYFTSSTAGVVGGIAQSGIAAIFYTSNGGSSFAPATVSGISVGDTITGFAYDGTTYVASAKHGATGKLFTSTNGSSWTKATTAGNHLTRIQFISTSLAFAIGEEGTLMKLSQPLPGNPIFQLVPTGMTGNFIDVYFKNDTEGVAIIDSVPSKGKIYKTFDGGLSWQLLSADGDYYHSLQLYDAANHKLVAAGKKGLVARVLLSAAPFGITKVSTGLSDALSFADAYDNGAGGVLAMAVSNTGPGIYTSYNIQASSPGWQSMNISTIAAPDNMFKKVILLDSSAATPYIKGILLTTNGKLYSFHRPYNSTTLFCQAVSISGGFSGKFFTDITANSQAFTASIYAFDTVSKTNYRLQFAGRVASGTQFSNAAGITGNINAIDIINSGTRVIMVGNSGHIEYTSTIASTTTWTNVALSSLPVAITKVRAVGSGDFMATGVDGAVWKNTGGVSAWYLKNSGTAERLNSMAVDASGNGLVAANNGQLFQLTAGNTQAPLFSSIASGLTAHLTDVAIEPGGTSAYITANGGQVLYMSNYSSPVPALAAAASPLAINGVAYKSGPDAAVVGNKALIANYYGSNAMITRELFTKGLNSIHFYDPSNGYAIDSSEVIRRTTDGGASWSVVVPANNSPKLTKIYATKANQAVLVGLMIHASVINGNALSAIAISGTIMAGADFCDVHFNKSNFGIIAGSSSRVAKIEPSGPTSFVITYIGQATTIAPIPGLRAVHVFNDSTFLVAGTRGAIFYYKGGSFYSQGNYTAAGGGGSTSLTFRDLYFHDNYTGYIVGTRGNAFKLTLTSPISAAGTTVNSLPWTAFCVNATQMSYTTNAQILNLNYHAIGFSSRTNGLIGGSDNNITINGYSPNNYARLLKEQSGYYSTRFWYDKLGRLVLSQNTKQFNKQAYSYTLYDALGRITEVGEKYENSSPKMSSVLGSLVNGAYNNNALDEAKFQTWVNAAGLRREVTHTYYDVQGILSGPTQNNLRKRVASCTFEDVYDGNDLTYNHATHYSYDIHGNVSRLWQENTQVSVSGQDLKQVDYQYDLISGKVNKVIYSPGQADQFMHRYSYDADNRITLVETSPDHLHYDLEAKYFYYAHGPLARVEYGKNQVQGLDYAYTLQGWIKGVNSNTLKKAKDMGSDGDLSFANPNGNFGRDIVGYTLNYYKGDYEAIDYVKWNTAASRFEAYTTGSNLLSNSSDLFNGNIASMATSISKVDTSAGGVITGARVFPLGNSYRYDQLNRITRSASYANLDTTTNAWLSSGATAGLYRNTFSYDANGNIKTQVKRDSVGALTDSLIYRYEELNSQLRRNRLYHVDDLVSTTPATDDLEDQGTFTTGGTINSANNYRFDEIGNLIRDNSESIDTIRWTVTGKIKAIIRASASPKDNLVFDYDASGNRVAKHVYTSANVWKYSTYYLRDAQGNVLSVYDKRVISATMSYKLDEQHLYGSSRIGMTNPNLEMIGATAPPDTTKSYLGYKHYELSNHLGNVLAVVSDKKIAIDNNNNKVIDYYVADQVSATDYYAFGSPMPGRRFTGVGYRYGFNGKENDNEVKGTGNQQDYGMRIYDNRLGRFLSVDPLTKSFPMLTPYQFASNTPIWAIDLDGEEAKIYQSNLKDNQGFKITMNVANSTTLDKEFNKTLSAQNKYDVYYYAFDSKVMYGNGEIYDGVSYTPEGFAGGGSGGILGTTNVVSSKSELMEKMKGEYDVSFVTPSDLDASFNDGKSVILIGIAEQEITPFGDYVKNPNTNWNIKKLGNLATSGAETIVHEEDAHASNILKGTKKSEAEEHGAYSGSATHSSPSTQDLLTDKKYENTRGGRTAREANTTSNKTFKTNTKPDDKKK